MMSQHTQHVTLLYQLLDINKDKVFSPSSDNIRTSNNAENSYRVFNDFPYTSTRREDLQFIVIPAEYHSKTTLKGINTLKLRKGYIDPLTQWFPNFFLQTPGTIFLLVFVHVSDPPPRKGLQQQK